MHGRVKIKTTAEQEEEKRKEREIKKQKYLSGLNSLFLKRKENIHDKEGLLISTQLLTANADALTLWNYRREILLSFKETLSEEDWQELLVEELKTTEWCLAKNPKSYGTWHHRNWIFTIIPSPPFEEELALCDQYLDKDERNFHCWDHRRFIIKICQKNLTDELKFTESLINKNFSNFSAWHYRSKLLPHIYPSLDDSPHPIPEEVFLKELKKVVTAVFTDPSDQSPWFFLRWLLAGKIKSSRLLQAGVFSFDERVTLALVFTKGIDYPSGLSVSLNGEKLVLEEDIKAYDNSKCIWLVNLPNQQIYDLQINLNCLKEEFHILTTMKELPVCHYFSSDYEGDNISPVAKNTLLELKNDCVSLDQLDKDNKWVLLTLVNLMSMLNATEFLPKIIGYLKQLHKIDQLRVNYYEDLRSKIIMEEKLKSWDRHSKTFSIADQTLTRLVGTHCISFAEVVDLSGNHLRSLAPLASLLNCLTLILDKNIISDLTSLKGLRRLKNLSLRSCLLKSINVLQDLNDIKSLKLLVLQGVKFSNEVDLQEDDIKKLIVGIKNINIKFD